MATLSTTITESVTINGKVYGNSVSKDYTGIEQVYSQVVTIGTTVQEMIGFAASEKAGELADDTLRYFRITNLDSTNFITIYFDLNDGGTDTAGFKLNPGASFILNDDDLGIATSASVTSLSQLDAIIGKADTSDVKVEIFIGLTS